MLLPSLLVAESGGAPTARRLYSWPPTQEAEWAPYLLLSGQKAYLSAALRAAQAPNPLTRQRGLFTLGLLGLPEGIKTAQKALRDPERRVRLFAAVALVLLRQPEGIAGATVALREEAEWLRYYALYGLWRLNSPRARQALRASAPYLSGFLATLLPRALQQPPSMLAITRPRGTPDPVRTQEDLWEAVSGALVVESDLWWHQGLYDQSIRAQWAALFFDPEYIDLYTNIAWLEWSMGRHGAAIRTYRQCVAANPKSWEAYQALGDYYARHGLRLLAVGYFRRAAELGSPPIARRRLGHLLRDLGEREQALQVWREILEVDPQDPIALREIRRMQEREKF